MKQFRAKSFFREAKKEGVSDTVLKDSYNEFLELGSEGQKKISLGAGLYKLRIASKSGRGKSGGARSLLAYKSNDRLIWLHLFSKNDKENITKSELEKLKIAAGILLKLDDDEIEILLEAGELMEMKNV